MRDKSQNRQRQNQVVLSSYLCWYVDYQQISVIDRGDDLAAAGNVQIWPGPGIGRSGIRLGPGP
jgi:hypothetical protein